MSVNGWVSGGVIWVSGFLGFCVYIRFFGNGGLWFRSYSGSLSKSAKVTKALLPLSFGASLRLGMPSLRSCSVGPPPSAIHGRGRLTRHPCRVAHYAEPPLGLSRGRASHGEAAYRPACFACAYTRATARADAPRGHASRDALRHQRAGFRLASLAERRASPAAFPRRAWERSQPPPPVGAAE
ncbi:hypothetical protein QFZ85_002141 [Pseudomonas frederiksbergensis]